MKTKQQIAFEIDLYLAEIAVRSSGWRVAAGIVDYKKALLNADLGTDTRKKAEKHICALLAEIDGLRGR